MKKCKYCGSGMKKTDEGCSVCGAKKTTDKK